MQIPYVGLNFAVYESLKDWLIKTKPFGLVDDNELGVATRLACGAAAGTVGQTVAYPLDVIRRRMQMVGWKDAASIVTGDGRSKASLEYTGMVDAFRKTVRNEGFGALYKGLVPNSVKVNSYHLWHFSISITTLFNLSFNKLCEILSNTLPVIKFKLQWVPKFAWLIEGPIQVGTGPPFNPTHCYGLWVVRVVMLRAWFNWSILQIDHLVSSLVCLIQFKKQTYHIVEDTRANLSYSESYMANLFLFFFLNKNKWSCLIAFTLMLDFFQTV